MKGSAAEPATARARRSFPGWLAVLATASLLAGGCSSVSVSQPVERRQLAPARSPQTVWIRDFTVPARGVEVSTPVLSSTPPDQHLADLLTTSFLNQAPRFVGPAKRLADDAAPPDQGLLVEGRFVHVNQGSRLLRTLFGFGLGRSRFETKVRVYNLAADTSVPWLEFVTAGGSNVEPGLAPGLAVAVVAPPVALPAVVPSVVPTAAQFVGPAAIATKGVSDDARRTSRMILAAIHDRLVSLGLTTRRGHPKIRGSFHPPAAGG